MYRVPSARLRRSTLFLGITGIAALVLVACGSDTPTATPAPPTSTTPPATTAPAAGAITIQLTAQNNSGQTGTATLTPKGDQTEVVLVLNVGPAGAGVAQPVHIHTGTCATLGGVVYPLTNLADGKSTTTVNVKLDALRTGGFAINAHKSGQEASVYTSCGNIPAAATASARLTVQLTAQNNSGQTGTATLTPKGDQTEVVLALNVGPAGAGVAQPVHIHTGTCATLGGVVYPLTNLADGKSTTTVNVKLDALRTGAFAINAHKSGQEVSVYTSCGNIPAASTSSSSGGDYDYNY